MFNGLTNIGKEYIAKCLAENKPITFTKVKIGDGLLDLDENAELLTDVKSLKKEVEILDKTQEGELTTLTILLDNSDIEVGYYPREIGIYVTDEGVEKLYWYINDGLETQWLCAANKYPIKFKQIINLMTTNLESVIVNWNGKDLFVDREFVEEKIKEKVRTFEIPTIAELQSRKNLKVGDIVEVLGYYSAGDGAGHKRIIANEDDGSGVQLNNKLWANIVHNGKVNVSWFGTKGDGTIDDGIYLKKVFKTPNLRKVAFDKQKLNIINERNIEIPSTIKEIDFALCKIFVDTSKGIPQEDWVTRNPVFSIKEQRDYTSLNTQELIELNNLNNTIYKNSITFKGIEKYGDDIVYRMFGTNDKNLEFYDCNLHMRYGTISSPFRYGINNIDRLRYRKLNKEPLVIKNLNFELTGINNQRMFCFLYITKDNVVLDNCYIDYEYNDLNNRKNLITFEDSVNVQINNLNAPQPIDNGLISEQKYDGYIVLMNDCGNVTLNNIKCRMPLHFIDNDLSSINTTCSLNIATNDTFEIYMYNSKVGKIDSHTNGYSMYFYNSTLSLVQNRGGGKIEFNSCTLQLMHDFQRSFFICNKFNPEINSYSQGAQICDYEIILNNCILEYSNNATKDRDHDRYCFIRLEEEIKSNTIAMLPTLFINNCIFDFRHIKASEILLHSYYCGAYPTQIYGGNIELNNITVLHCTSSKVIFNSIFYNDTNFESVSKKNDGIMTAIFNNVKGMQIIPFLVNRNLDLNRKFIENVKFICDKTTILMNESGIGKCNLIANNCLVNDFNILQSGNWHFINSTINITDYYNIFRSANTKLRFDYCIFKQSTENDFDSLFSALKHNLSIAQVEFNFSILEKYKGFDITEFNKKNDYAKITFKRVESILTKYDSRSKNYGIYSTAMTQDEANSVNKFDYYFNVEKNKFELPQQTIIVQVQQLNSIYHLEKMKQENVYDDYITYMDEKTAYDKKQRDLEKQKQLAYQEALKENPELTYEEFMSLQPMTLNLVEEPQPSLALQEFIKKYL